MAERQFEVLDADDVAVRGSDVSEEIKNEKCILCGMPGRRLVYAYDPPKDARLFGLLKAKDREFHSVEVACSQDCADMIILRKL
jgi:hypothetical protein